MGRRARRKEPIRVHLDRLEEKHTSGVDDQGRRWKIRGAPVGAELEVRPGRKQTARRMNLIRPAADAVRPECRAFGLCGGCQLQEMPLDGQRREKQDFVTRTVLGDSPDPSVRIHPIRGADQGYHYRNKIELSFGSRRFFAEAPGPDTVLEGSFLGFHPPGWYSKIVDLDACPLGTSVMNRVIEVFRDPLPSPAWNSTRHTGHWRHLVLRDAGTPEEPRLLVSLVTTTSVDRGELKAVGRRLADIPGVEGVLWITNDGVAEVANGHLEAVLHGSSQLDFRVAGLDLRLPHDAFFQVNTPGAEVLIETISEAAGAGGTLVDLYCGSGLIGMALARNFDRVLGIEVHVGATLCASENARRNGIDGEWITGKVEEILPTLDLPSPRTVVVDPPRVGLHPKVARYLAELKMERLVYVACKPSSLARDARILAEGGWKLEELWTVDLFPQTHHIEAIARFSGNHGMVPNHTEILAHD